MTKKKEEQANEQHSHKQHKDCKCKEEIQAKQKCLDKLLRLQAEFDNYRKRTQKDAQKAKQDGLIEAVEQLLPVLDTFKAAEKQLKPEEFKGLKQVKDQLTKALENLGVKQIKAKGETFDPNVHNAIVVEKDENEDAQVVLDVLQEGYSLDDRVIRHSVVKINE